MWKYLVNPENDEEVNVAEVEWETVKSVGEGVRKEGEEDVVDKCKDTGFHLE